MAARTTCMLFATLAMLTCSRDQDEPPQNETGSDEDTGDGSGTGDACAGPEGCYDCEPTEPAQILNHCTDANCEPFPNTQERLPLLGADGSLPPIP